MQFYLQTLGGANSPWSSSKQKETATGECSHGLRNATQGTEQDGPTKAPAISGQCKHTTLYMSTGIRFHCVRCPPPKGDAAYLCKLEAILSSFFGGDRLQISGIFQSRNLKITTRTFVYILSVCTAELPRVQTQVRTRRPQHTSCTDPRVVCLIVFIGVLHQQPRGSKASSSC